MRVGVGWAATQQKLEHPLGNNPYLHLLAPPRSRKKDWHRDCLSLDRVPHVVRANVSEAGAEWHRACQRGHTVNSLGSELGIGALLIWR